MAQRDTIVGCCTSAFGIGAIALVRISGPDAFRIADSIVRLSGGVTVQAVATHTVHHGYVIDRQGERIDEVLVIVMHAPRTFTGEDTVEITCHGNPLIVQRIIAEACAAGACRAERGSFTKQALENKKIDLLQAEGIHELIAATTEARVKQSLAQVGGSLSHGVAELERALVTMSAWCEASFEFAEEVEEDFARMIQQQLAAAHERVTLLLRAASLHVQMREGVRIALLGSVNAGKSSLFNALLRQQRAIVHSQAGTTRDTIEAPLLLGGCACTLVDTAGLRATDDPVEREGIVRSWNAGIQADLLLLVLDQSQPLSDEAHKLYERVYAEHAHKMICVITKIDAPAVYDPSQLWTGLPVCRVSSHTGAGIVELESMIAGRLNQLMRAHDVPYIVNARQRALLQQVDEALGCIQQELASGATPHYELISAQVQQALSTLAEMTGRSAGEAALDQVFREFCIGK